MNEHLETVELKFILEVEDEWPPVAIEGLPFSKGTSGYSLKVAPLFIKDLSVGDVISITRSSEGNVESWSHIEKSGRTTIWLRRMTQTDTLQKVLSELRTLECNTVQLPNYGCYAIDVPAERNIKDVDACLNHLDASCVAIAFPSFRHPE